jgi:hypothetical protein
VTAEEEEGDIVFLEGLRQIQDRFSHLRGSCLFTEQRWLEQRKFTGRLLQHCGDCLAIIDRKTKGRSAQGRWTIHPDDQGEAPAGGGWGGRRLGFGRHWQRILSRYMQQACIHKCGLAQDGESSER